MNDDNDYDHEDESLQRAMADLEMIQAAYPDEITMEAATQANKKFPMKFTLHLSTVASLTMKLEEGYPKDKGVQVSDFRASKPTDKTRLEAAVQAVRRVSMECLEDEMEGSISCCAVALEVWNDAADHGASNDTDTTRSTTETINKEKSRMMQQQQQQNTTYHWISGEPLMDRKSSFQAHLCAVHSEKEAKEALHQLVTSSSKLQRATHNMSAWRIVETLPDGCTTLTKHDNDDDGEHGAGSKLAYLLDMRKDENVLVVVSRWYGGIHLGPKRFAHIVNVARELLVANPQLTTVSAEAASNIAASNPFATSTTKEKAAQDKEDGGSSSSNNNNNKRYSDDSQRQQQTQLGNLAASNENNKELSTYGFDYTGDLQQERYNCYSDSDASFEYQAHHGLWEVKRRNKLLTVERKRDLHPAANHHVTKNKRRRKNHLLKMVDFGQLTAAAASGGDTAFKWAATRVLFEKMSEQEVDSLVGLATTLESKQEEEHGEASNTAGITESSITANSFTDPQTHNPLLIAATDPPLPPSMVKYIQSRAAESLLLHVSNSTMDDTNSNNRIDSCFGASTAVATSMALEDAITASLLPLAGLHVLRCRAMEDMMVSEQDDDNDGVAGHASTHSQPTYSRQRTATHPITGEKVELDMEKIAWRTESPFQEWTLPPEEAIMKLLEQGLLHDNNTKLSANHFLAEPSRQFHTDDSIQDSDAQQQQQRDLSALPLRERTKLFAKRNNINANVIASNLEVFSMFMSS
ncbi:MAG: hypothetical protein SGILL_000670 [Bacillariaceae sp.]